MGIEVVAGAFAALGTVYLVARIASKAYFKEKYEFIRRMTHGNNKTQHAGHE